MLDSKQIMDIIPHRSPFLLVDRIDELTPGVSAVGRKCVTYNEPFFAGHFPNEPVMPGVLIIEALAQVGTVVMLSKEENKGKIGYFGGINKARFREKVKPGDVLTLKVEVIKTMGNIGIAKGIAYEGDKVYAEAEMTFAVS